MKINLNDIDRSCYHVNTHIIAGEAVYLVVPKDIGVKWRKDTLVLRSSVWNSDGELISGSFKKFFNWGEQPELVYTPFSMTANGGVNIIEKIDGSTLIVSRYKGETIIRTRGTMDATQMEKNGDEIAIIKQKYRKAFRFPDVEADLYSYFGHLEVNTLPFSFIYEWVSPINKIVINYPEPDIYLVGIVRHEDYSYCSQQELDSIAKTLGVKRPRRFTFKTFDEIFAAIYALDYESTKKFASPKEMLAAAAANSSGELTRNFEGFCVYCNRDQDIRKVKSAWYLARHALKNELGSIDKVIDLWVTMGYPNYEEFYTYLLTDSDYETAEACRGFISRISNAKEQVERIVEGMQNFILQHPELQHKPRGKKEADIVFGAYGKDTNRASYVFSLLDGKDLNRDQYKKLLYQVLKK